MRILVGGGTGLIGQALSRALLERGDEVVILTRQNLSPAKGVTYLRWDGEGVPDPLKPEDFEAVVHLAGASIAGQRWTSRYKQVLWQSRIQSTRAFARWLQTAERPPRFLSASAVGYYGHTCSIATCTEDSPSGTDFLAGLARAWEAAAQEAPRPPFIARLGIVLAREGGAFPKLLQGFRYGVGTYFWPGVQGISWVHIQDVVKAFLWAIAHPEAAGPYNICAPNPVSARQLAEAIARRRGIRLLLPIPPGPLYWLYGELADTLHKGQYAEPVRLLNAGFSFEFPTIEAALTNLMGNQG